MKTLLAAVSALALVTPALAQTVEAPATSAAVSASQSAVSTTAVPPSTTDATTSTSTTVTTPAPDGSATSTTTTTAAAPAQGPEAVIAAEFPTYDKDSSGALDKTEFSAWLTTLKAKSGEPAMKPAELKTWTSASFVKADKDKNKTISQAELTTYLTAGA